MFSDTNNLNAYFKGFPPGGEKRLYLLPFTWLPLGGRLCRVAAVMRGAAYYAQPIFDFLNIFNKKFLKIKGRRLFSDTNHLNAALRGFPLGGGSAR